MQQPEITAFRQKRAGCRTTFDFGEEELVYNFDTSRSKIHGKLAYENILMRIGFREVRLWWIPYAAVCGLTLCTVTSLHYYIMYDMFMLAAIAYATVLLFLTAYLVALLRRTGGITSISLEPALHILHDGQQNAILQEIKRRRLEAMKRKLARVDSTQPYYEEARKFTMLKEEGAIDENQYRIACEQIARMRDKA